MAMNPLQYRSDYRGWLRAAFAALTCSAYRLSKGAVGGSAFRRCEAFNTQTLDPILTAYFRDVAQTSHMLDLLTKREEIQRQATEQLGRRSGDGQRSGDRNRKRSLPAKPIRLILFSINCGREDLPTNSAPLSPNKNWRPNNRYS
jgi:hypothetical protein